MSEPHDDDQEDAIVHRIDDAVVPDSDAQARPSLQSSRARWARVVRQQRDGALDPKPNSWIEFA